MSSKDRISDSISTEATFKKVYEYEAHKVNGDKVSYVFLNHCGERAWETQKQRDQIFTAIWSEEAAKNLKNRTVIELYGFSPDGGYHYAYRHNGKRIDTEVLIAPENEKTASVAKSDNESEVESLTDNEIEDVVTPEPKRVYYKIHELSSRHFKKTQTAHAIIESLKAVVELLSTPFTYLYQFIAGSGEPRQFASMLVPVEHNHVGEITHDVVLSQIQFMGQVFGNEDPRDHGKNLGLEHTLEKKISINRTSELQRVARENVYVGYSPQEHICEETATEYNIWIEGDKKEANINYSYGDRERYDWRQKIAISRPVMQKTENGWKPVMLKAEHRGETVGQSKEMEYEYVENPNFGKEDIRREIWCNGLPTWITFKKYDPIFLAIQDTHEWKKVDYDPTLNEADDQVEVKFYGEWLTIPKNHILVKGRQPEIDQAYHPSEKERNPQFLSATQHMAKILYEAHEIGKEFYDALNEGESIGKEFYDAVTESLGRDMREAIKNSKLHVVGKEDAALGNLVHKLRTIASPANQHVILPIAHGEGREYLPHFLVFSYVEEPVDPKQPNGPKTAKVILKHICFSSPNLEAERTQIIKTYDVTNTCLGDRMRCEQFARSLFSIQAYKRSKDAKEAKLKGPNVEDLSLDNVILRFGTDMGETVKPVDKKTSRDPVKAIYEIVKQLNIKENGHLGWSENTLENIVASKGKFYSTYVNHLIKFYEENEGRLLPKERSAALDGIKWYAHKVRHYMEKEIGVEAALLVTKKLTDSIEQKIDELKEREALEQNDLKNLKNKVSLFEANLAFGLDEVIQRTTVVKEVESSRVSTVEWGGVLKLKQDLARTTMDPMRRDITFQRFKTLLKRADFYLRKKEPLAAKTLLLGMMQALPPADDSKHQTFWGTLKREKELADWTKELATLVEKMLDASLRSGTYPLKPHEVFELNVVIPLIQRHLFSKIIPLKLEKLYGADGPLETYKDNQDTITKLVNAQNSFIQMREKEIEEEVRKKLEEKWKKDDETFKTQRDANTKAMERYRKEYRRYKEYKDNPNTQLRTRYLKPDMPVLNDVPTTKRIAKDRKKEEAERIVLAKRTDGYLNDLKNMDVRTFDRNNWDFVMSNSCARAQAVLGNFARIMGIPKELYAYKIGKANWVAKTFDTHKNGEIKKRNNIWLMAQDCSLLIGYSPEFQRRYETCLRCLNTFNTDKTIEGKEACNFIIGYDGLGDGTQFVGEFIFNTANKQAREHEERVKGYHAGFFNSGKGGELLAPEELSSIRKVDEARKILGDPTVYLKPYTKPGVMGAIGGFFTEDYLNADVIKKQFADMPAIHMVAAEKCFTLSDQVDGPGSLATNGRAEEPPSYLERLKYMGQLTREMPVEKVGGDQERDKVDQVARAYEKLYKALDPAQEFILRESALSKGDQLDDLSYLAISQCMHFIYQYPEKLEIPQVQHTLHKTFFQQGLIKEHLRKNPEFFVYFSKVLDEVCEFLQERQCTVSELFLREVCEGIRRQALDLQKELQKIYGRDWATEISEALPVYDEDHIVGVFRGGMDSSEQKVFATFALSYFCHRLDRAEKLPVDPHSREFPSTDDINGWRDMLKAFFIMQQSALEIGHSGMQAELLYKVQRDLLPRISLRLRRNPKDGFFDYRHEFLRQLTGLGPVLWDYDKRAPLNADVPKEHRWQVNTKKPYTYTLQVGEEKFEVDLRTGQGCPSILRYGNRCKLPEQIRSDDNFSFLFKDLDPLVDSQQDLTNPAINDYTWTDEKSGSKFTVRYKSDDRSIQIFQEVEQKKYQFQRLHLSTRQVDKVRRLLSRNGNETVENLIKTKGVWLFVDKNDQQDTSKAMIAQHGWNLARDPVTLHLNGSKISGATLGKGKDRKWICSGLATGLFKKNDVKLLSFRNGDGLMLLSKNKSHVDEIRFPPDPITNEQLALKRSDKESDVWVVVGREDWAWQLANTKAYEESFGPNWREYILPLKNQKTGEEEIWIFTHPVTADGKRGSQLKFLKSAVDYVDVAGGMLSNLGVGQDIPMDELRSLAASAESFFGGIDGLMQGVQNSSDLSKALKDKGDIQGTLVEIFKHLISPRGIRYSACPGAEKASYAGFFYLAHIAALRGDWGVASNYLQLMLTNGDCKTSDDLRQLQRMCLIVLGLQAINGKKKVLSTKSPLEAAFLAKATAAVFALSVSLKAQQGIDLFDSIEKRTLLSTGGSAYYFDYRKGLATHQKQLEDYGLLLTKNEEELLLEDIKLVLGAAVVKGGNFELSEIQSALGSGQIGGGKEKTTAKRQAAPVEFDPPKMKEMKEMLQVMADYIEPYGVWSIHDLHKKHGAIPKWETVLANFWCYWEWILREDLQYEDIAFLLQEIPQSKKFSVSDIVTGEDPKRTWKAIDTARRTLLFFWHYCKQGEHENFWKKNDVSTNSLLFEIKIARRDMPSLAQTASEAQQLKQEAEMSPGIVREISSLISYGTLTLKRIISNFSYKEEVGGIPHVAGYKHNFITASEKLLGTFYDAFPDLENKKIHPNGFIGRSQNYVPPQVEKPLTQLEKHKQEAWDEFSRSILKSKAIRNLFDGMDQKYIKAVFNAILDLPDFEDAWKKVEALLTEGMQGASGDAVDLNAKNKLELLKKAVVPLKKCLGGIHSRYAEAAGFPKSPYPKTVEAVYEPVEVKPATVDLNWGQYFVNSLVSWNIKAKTREIRKSIWEKRKVEAKKYFDPESALTEREQYKLMNICKGIDNACEDLKKRTRSAFKFTALKEVYEKIGKNIKELSEVTEELRKLILKFARSHARDLGITNLLLQTDEQFIQKILNLYRYGEIGTKLEEEGIAELITEYILILTELQQYQKAKSTCKDLVVIWQQIQDSIPDIYEGQERDLIAQSKANRSVDWLLYSADLKRFLEEGADRLRYTEKVEFSKDRSVIWKYLKEKLPRIRERHRKVVMGGPEDWDSYKKYLRQFLDTHGDPAQNIISVEEGGVKIVRYITTTEFSQDREKIWEYIQDRLPNVQESDRELVMGGPEDWAGYKNHLRQFLDTHGDPAQNIISVEEGGVKIVRYFLNDQKFTRRYLTSDVSKQWVSRKKAISALEDMLRDMVDKGEDKKPVRFIKAKMGTGKSDFIFPEAIDLLIHMGYEPMMITTDDLVDQLKISMGHKAFVFKFSIDFGLDKVYANELDRLGEEEKNRRLEELKTHKNIVDHLETLKKTLDHLKAEKKAVLTSPSQVAALRDKRVQLQGMLIGSNKNADGEDSEQKDSTQHEIFQQLQLVKGIEAHFKKDDTIYLVDEDVNFDISFEYNFATGEYRTVDKIRFDVAERLMLSLYKRHQDKKGKPAQPGAESEPDLWEKIVNNDLRAVRDVKVEFREAAGDLFDDTDFWEAAGSGWKPEQWKTIDREEFIDYVLGIRKDLPEGMPEWNPKLADSMQQEKAYVAALKTFLSRTLESVTGVNPQLERGISSSNGVTTVPFSDGNEKKGVLYGEESENILHHMFHYAGAGNKIGEEIFRQKVQDWGGRDTRMSPLSSTTWKEWKGKIGAIASSDKAYKNDLYLAFINSKELGLERIQFLRHIMLETDFIRVYIEQISYNSQDLGIGVDVRVGSGTGQPFALNLSDYTDDSSHAPDDVLGETLLCLDLNRKAETFEASPLDYIDKMAAEEKCQAILNFDYEVLGNDCEKLASRLRQAGRTKEKERQMIYRVEEEQQLVKKIWNPGEPYFPMTYEPGAINPNGLFLYSRRDGRGVHFHVPRGGHKYGVAMVGAGNQEDAIAQLIWRLRHMDMGHEMEFAQDKKTTLQVHKVCKERDLWKEGDDVTIGHDMRYFTLNTLDEEDIKNVKASIFKEQKPLKTHIDHEVRKPYDLKDVQDTTCLEEIEGKVIYKATKSLYIMNSEAQWMKEYQGHKTTNPIKFMYDLCNGELDRIDRMEKEFSDDMDSIVKKHEFQAGVVRARNSFKTWNVLTNIPADGNIDMQAFEKQLDIYLKGNIQGVTPEQIAVAREILRKYYALKVGFAKARCEIRKEIENLKNEEYKQFLKNNLPEKIAADPNQGSRNEQKVQQMQQQKQQQTQKKTERVMIVADGDEPTRPIDYWHFKDVILGKKEIQFNTYSKYSAYRTEFSDLWKQNGNFLPLRVAMQQDREGIKLPKDYDNTYISHRAWRLLKKMGRIGVPSVDLLVIQHDDQCHTVIITPAEREETVAKGLFTERKQKKDRDIQLKKDRDKLLKKEPSVKEPPVIEPSVKVTYSEENAWNDMQGALLKLAQTDAQKVQINDAFKNQQHRLKPYLTKFLQGSSDFEQAWKTLIGEMEDIRNILGLNLGILEKIFFMSFVKNNLKEPFEKIYNSFNSKSASASPEVINAYTKEDAWKGMKRKLIHLANDWVVNDNEKACEDSKKVLTQILDSFLNQPKFADAWEEFKKNKAKIRDIFGIKVPLFGGSKFDVYIEDDNFKGAFKEIYAKFHKKRVAPLVENIAVYPLSNEKIKHRMMIDCVTRPYEKPKWDNGNLNTFIHSMVMNKLFLNWTEFTLDELDYLIYYIETESENRVEGLTKNLKQFHGKETYREIKEDEDDKIIEHSPKTFLLIEMIRKKDKEYEKWAETVAMRKLKENYNKFFWQAEIAAIKEWIDPKNMNVASFQNEIEKLTKMKATFSVELLQKLRVEVIAVRKLRNNDKDFSLEEIKAIINNEKNEYFEPAEINYIKELVFITKQSDFDKEITDLRNRNATGSANLLLAIRNGITSLSLHESDSDDGDFMPIIEVI